MHADRIATVAMVLTLGCKPELPPLEYRSERAWVGSDVVDQVCGGTLARIDRELEQIERRLELPVGKQIAEVYIVSDETSTAYCKQGSNCVLHPDVRVLINGDQFSRVIAHELVHFRLAFNPATVDTSRLFREGIAVGVAPAACPRSFPQELNVDDLLEARSAGELMDRGGYYLGGELFAWSLDVHGPDQVLALMKEVRKRDRPSKVRRKYRERFGSEIDDDLRDHFRSHDPAIPEDVGCIGPPAPTDASGTQIELRAEMDCDAADVQNNFSVADGAYVEWILTVDESSAGQYALVGNVPEWTVLTLEPCRCVTRKQEPQYVLPRTISSFQTIDPGTYRLRWNGQPETGGSLDVQLVRL